VRSTGAPARGGSIGPAADNDLQCLDNGQQVLTNSTSSPPRGGQQAVVEHSRRLRCHGQITSVDERQRSAKVTALIMARTATRRHSDRHRHRSHRTPAHRSAVDAGDCPVQCSTWSPTSAGWLRDQRDDPIRDHGHQRMALTWSFVMASDHSMWNARTPVQGNEVGSYCCVPRTVEANWFGSRGDRAIVEDWSGHRAPGGCSSRSTVE